MKEDKEERNMYWKVKNILEKNGYNHYEISNFAKHGSESKHNLDCWKQKEYVGFGVAAHSYTNGVRYSNIENIEEYIKNAEHFINSIKTDKEYQEENGWHGYYNKEIVELARMLEHILSDYKRVLKENEELNLKYYMLYAGKIENMKAQDIKIRSQVIPVQKVKDKIEELKINLVNKQGEELLIYESKIDVLQELLEVRK